MNRASLNVRRLRQMIAHEAARIMVEEGVKDFRLAKDKALRHLALGQHDTHQILPSNAEINDEVVARLRLFQGERQPAILRRLRETALEAMDLLAEFDPRLTGSVLEGTATEHSDINLHLVADSPESVLFFLMDRGIDHEPSSALLRFGGSTRELPGLRFDLHDILVDCVIFSMDETRDPPLSKIDGKPMRRMRRKQLEALLNAPEDAPA